MNFLLVFIIVIAMASQGVTQKQYNFKVLNKCTFLFNSLSMLFAAAFFFVFAGGKLHFELSLVPYCLGFALFFGMAVLFKFLAVCEGPLSITSLATSYSLVIPTVSGILLYNEKVNVFFYIGFALLLLSIVFINEYKKENRFSLKWLVYVFLAFVGNGFCSTVQTYQQHVFDGKYKSELMIIALVSIALVLFVMSMFYERKDVKYCTVKGLHLMAVYGISIALVNLLVMILSTKMNVSLMFPLVSAGGLIANSLISIFVYKEKLTKKQYVGLSFGALAVILINI